MVASTWKPSPNFTPQSGITKRHITLHWMVGALASTDAVFLRKGSGASAHYGIEGDRVHQYVEESQYAWADGNTHSNRYGISIEHAGGWLLPGGGRQHPSQETHETSAQLCADISRRWGLGNLVVGVNLFPHNHWVATMCPGTLDLAWIAARANQILNPQKKGVRHMYRAVLKDTKRVAYFDSITFHETGDGSPDDNAWGRYVGKPGLSVTATEWDAYRSVAASNAAKLGTPSSGGGASTSGASKADVDAAAERVISKIPTTATLG